MKEWKKKEVWFDIIINNDPKIDVVLRKLYSEKREREKCRQQTKVVLVWSPSPTTWVVPCGSGGADELATLLTFKILQGGWARALITIIMGVGVQARNHGPWDTR